MNENSIIQDEFDYIVIGAGAAGCVVERRVLSPLGRAPALGGGAEGRGARARAGGRGR